VRRRLSSGADDNGRGESPGRALQVVKEKISEYHRTNASTAGKLAGRQQQHQQARKQPLPEPASKQDMVPDLQSGQHHGGDFCSGAREDRDRVYDDASDDIADIDQRLQALQDFLRSAKAAG
jgi:hypothetical protein